MYANTHTHARAYMYTYIYIYIYIHTHILVYLHRHGHTLHAQTAKKRCTQQTNHLYDQVNPVNPSGIQSRLYTLTKHMAEYAQACVVQLGGQLTLMNFRMLHSGVAAAPPAAGATLCLLLAATVGVAVAAVQTWRSLTKSANARQFRKRSGS